MWEEKFVAYLKMIGTFHASIISVRWACDAVEGLPAA